VILTLRRASDGGHFRGSEAERASLLARLLASGFSAVDLEGDLDATGVEEAARSAGSTVIRSLHDFSGVPRDLAGRLSALARSPREIPKAAVMVHGAADLARLLEVFASARGARKILLGMGEAGMCTRVLAPRLGSLLCYSSVPGVSAAPGHLDPQTLCGLYRFRSVGQGTRVFGVMGSPVSHSLSPLIHNRGFASLGLDAVYVPFLADDAAGFLRAAALLGVSGLSVTVPHKQAVIPLLSAQDPAVREAGACNTLLREAEGWAGTNTDEGGFLAPLREELGGRVPPGLRAVVIGAGGAARSVVHALSSAGARVLVLNRTPGRARELAAAFSARWGPLGEEGAAMAGEGTDLVVQATSAGLHGQGDPFPELRFTGGELVYDLVYAPPVTAFLVRAREAGCRVIPGGRMLLAQATEQFRLFTGVAYPGEAARGIAAELEGAAPGA
jgi:3-dehydroquinate dehydratase / shikimate dehydrogenase